LRALASVQLETLTVLGTGIGCPGEMAALEAEFAQAVASLWMAFQPLVSAKQRTVFGYEALLRTQGCSLYEPAAVLTAAERLNAVWALGRAIRAHVARQLARTEASSVMFVNLHPWDLMDPELFAEDAPLTAYAERVVLEITERAALDRVHDTQGRVGLLRSFGFRIAVDDLGAGYAGLASFAQLEPDIVKLDISLVRGIHGSLVKRRLVSSMVTLCQELGALVVAEGIETEAERDVLVDLGCDLLQGFRFAKPGPPLPRANW
ncbi:MAG: EAL domain-containing protein, partial [Myxococcales bacterium]|nr:EAL domain-containing protein [Myxococcales bacterium]